MALTNTKERYGTVAQIFHWTTAILIIGLLIGGSLMGYLPEDGAAAIDLKIFVYSLHKTIGVTLLVIAIARILWAFINPRPKPLHPERKAEVFAAETVHWMLYIAIILMPVSGLLHHFASTGFAPIWWPLPQDVSFIPKNEELAHVFAAMHWVLAIIMTVSLLAHVGGAIKHARIDRDETVARMVPGRLQEGFRLSAEALAHKSPVSCRVLAAAIIGVGLAGAAGSVVLDRPGEAVVAEAPVSADAESGSTGEHGWQIVPEQSALNIEIAQLGSAVGGGFAEWTADINFNPDDLSTATVDARITIASLSLGTVADQAKGSDFLNAEAHPFARFTSDDFSLGDDGNYLAAGTLEIAGVSQPFDLSFTLDIDGNTATMSSNSVIDRLDFGVGAEKYGTEDSVAFPVKINIEIIAEKSW